MKAIYTTILLVAFSSVFAQEKYAKDELKQDFEYLYSSLKKSSYNMFVNTPEEDYNEAFKSVMTSIPDSLTLIEVYRLFQPFVALAGLGHCHLDYPFQRLYGTYLQNGGLLFPLNVQIEGDKVFVKNNYSTNDLIRVGDEILSINGESMQDIMTVVYKYISAENNYFKSTFVDMISLPRMMWILEESSDRYEVKIKNTKGTIKSFNLDPIAAGAFEEAFAKEKSILETDRIIKFNDENAYLKPGPFLNANGTGNTSEIETFNTDEFFYFLDSAYTEIAKNKSANLIIDLRNNSGGNNSHSDEMLSYFANKPFRFCSKFKVKTSQMAKKFWKKVNDTTNTTLKKQILSHKDGEVFESEIPFCEPKPDSLKFKGNVYVLINRYSFSQASITAAMIQDYKFGIVIGEETADPAMYGSIHQFDLPNTKIAVSYPKALIVRPSGKVTLKGTVPDYVVANNVFSEKDEILDFTLELIRNSLGK